MIIEQHSWFDDTAEIARLLRWLTDHERDQPVTELTDIIGVVEKPWHWGNEYEAMLKEQGERGEL